MKQLFVFRKKELIYFYILTICLSILTVSSAYILKLISDVANNNSDLNYNYLVIITILFVIVQYIVHYYQQLETERLSKVLSNDLKHKVIDYISGLTVDEYSNFDTGYYISQLTSQIQLIEMNYFYTILWGSYLFFQFSAALIGAFIINPILVVFVLLLCIPFIVIPLITKSKLIFATEKVSHATNEVTSSLTDYLEGKIDWHTTVREDRFRFRSKKLVNHLLNIETEKVKIDNQVGIFNKIFSEILYYGVWLIGTYFVLENELPFGSLLAFTNLVANLAFPLNSAVGIWSQFIGGKKLADNMLRIIDANRLDEPLENNVIVQETPRLLYDNISYFINDRCILNNVNLSLDFDKRYLIRGESGAGKSTLIKLLFHQYRPTKGKIMYNNIVVNQENYSTILDSIAYIPQHGHVFDSSLVNNITMFDEVPNYSKVNESLKLAGLEKWIDTDLLKTNKDIKKQNISGGEKQRLLLARALYRQPIFIFIDELSASLDTKLIPQIEKTLLELGIGFAYIAHQYTNEFAKQIDQIIEIKDGHVQ